LTAETAEKIRKDRREKLLLRLTYFSAFSADVRSELCG